MLLSKEKTTKKSKSARKLFIELIPTINKVKCHNFTQFLVRFLREIEGRITLHDFCTSICDGPFNPLSPRLNVSSNSDQEAVELCKLVLDTFRDPTALNVFSYSKLLKNNLLSSINFEVFRRNFLAIKILLDSVKTVQDSSRSDIYLAKSSVYKAYYIICKKLIGNCAHQSNSRLNLETLILNPRNFGKISKVVFCDVPSKRLGKRGYSKFHYLGIKWNDDVIDDEIRSLVELDFDDLATKLNCNDSDCSTTPSQPTENIVTDANFEIYEDFGSIPSPQSQLLKVKPFNDKPIYSFVDSIDRYSLSDCNLFSFENFVGKHPQQSQMANQLIKRSMFALMKREINVFHLVQNFDAEFLAIDSVNNFLQDITYIIWTLRNSAAPNEDYLHLYLITTLFIFPKCVATKEDSFENLSDLLLDFVNRLEFEFTCENISVTTDLMRFTKIIRKMIEFNTCIVSRVKAESASLIVRLLVNDVSQDQTSNQTAKNANMNQLILKAVVTACNAAPGRFIECESSLDHSKLVLWITKSYAEFCEAVSESVMKLPDLILRESLEGSTYNLQVTMFTSLACIFNQVWLKKACSVRLPIQLINYIVMAVTNELQQTSFQNYDRNDPELSKEVFKTWWLHTTISQAYAIILSEVVSLSHLVS